MGESSVVNNPPLANGPSEPTPESLSHARLNPTLVEHRKIVRSNVVFNCIKKSNNQLSKNDIVRFTHYSMTTVSAIVDELISKGIVREEESKDSRVGRHPVLLSVNENSMYFAGLECSATTMTITVLNCMSAIAYQDTLTMDEPKANDILAAMGKILNHLGNQRPDIWSRLINVTISLPGKFDPEKGVGISYISVKDWCNIDVKSFLSHRFEKEFRFIHNIDSMLLGYQLTTGLDDNRSLLFIVLRRGVGARLYSKGTLMSEYGISCELGHLKARNSNRLCNCGNRGCYDTEVSIPALRSKIMEAIRANRLYSLHSLYSGDASKLVMQDFYNLIRENDAEALDVLRETATYTSELIAEAVMILTPDIVVLYSDLCQLGQPFTSVIEKTVPGLLPQSEKAEVPIEYHPLDLYLCSLGAAINGMRTYFYETSNVI